MRFNRAEMIQRIDSKIKAREAEAARETAERRDAVAGQVAAWTAANGDAARKAAQAITAKLKKGQPVTWADLGLRRWGSSSDWPLDGDLSDVEPVKPKTASLVNLRAFLATVTDDEITSAGLRDAGYRDLASLLA